MTEHVPPEHIIESGSELLRLAAAFQQSRVLLTACELGVFTALADADHDAAQVAAIIGADRRGTERLLDALCALGLLEKTDARYRNSEASRRYLVDGAPQDLGLKYQVHQWDNWSLLTEAVRRGQTTVAKPFQDPPTVWLGAVAARGRRAAARVWAVASRSDHWLRAFVAHLRARARRRAPVIIDLLDLSAVERLLDVGGGAAIYAIAFAQAHEALRVTVFERPEVVPMTRENVAAAGLSDRIDAVGGDFYGDELGRGFDLVFISETVHANSYAQNLALTRKAFEALSPGGRLVVQDFILDDDRAGPAVAALFSVEMLMSTRGGDTYTRAEVHDWMTAAGFVGITETDTSVDSTLVIGHKPAS